MGVFGSNASAEAHVRVCAHCRGEGVGYTLLAAGPGWTSVRVTATTSGGRPVPCATYLVDTPWLGQRLGVEPAGAWVVVTPLLGQELELHVSAGAAESAVVKMAPLQSKLLSRALGMRKPEVAATLRGYERRFGAGAPRASIDQVWPAEGGDVVWRVRATFPHVAAGGEPILRAFDESACELDATVVVMEDQLVPDERDQAASKRLVTFSCRLPEDVRSFYVTACIDGDDFAAGFDGMNAPRAAGMLDFIQNLTTDAGNARRYAAWFEEHRATPNELEWQRGSCARVFGAERPSFEVLVPVASSVEGLSESVASVLDQTYDRLHVVVVASEASYREASELLAPARDGLPFEVRMAQGNYAHAVWEELRSASGDYVGVLACGNTLEANALWSFALAIRKSDRADALYCDEDIASDGCGVVPAFKPFPNYGDLYSRNFVGGLLVFSKAVARRVVVPSAREEGAEDYSLSLQVFELAREVVQVPRVLHHRAAPSPAGEKKTWRAGQAALEAHLARRGIRAKVEHGPLAGTYDVRFCVPDPAPLASIVIPTRDHADLLRTCVTSILSKTTYANYEIVLVENNSTDAATFALYDELCAGSERVRVVTWEPPVPGAFNYSAIVNFGVSQSAGELVVLLNNDTEVVEPSWLDQMVGCLERPEVGVVGAKLLFGDGLIQHVGMAANPEGNFCHVCQNLTRDAAGPGGRAVFSGDYSMVTGACQMVRRSLFDELGGYDEELAVGFNDGDFCLRAREAGYAVTVARRAVLHHREFSTRGRESTDARLRERFLVERARMMQKHAGFFAQGDPAINPNLDPFGSYFEL